MRTKVQKKTNEVKLNNQSFPVLRKIQKIEPSSFRFCSRVFDIAFALDEDDWCFEKEILHLDTSGLSLSMYEIEKAGFISKYQKYCMGKLSSVLYDARLLYENNIIDFLELKGIAARVKKNLFKRLKSIEKAYSKNQLADNNLDSESLLLLKAKLAILENEN